MTVRPFSSLSLSLSLFILSHFSFLTRCFPLAFPAFPHSFCHIPSRDTNCSSGGGMSHKRLVLCHLLPAASMSPFLLLFLHFSTGNSSQVRVMELSLVMCIKRQKLSQMALAHKHCLAAACVTISLPATVAVKTVDSQRKSLSKMNSWRVL